MKTGHSKTLSKRPRAVKLALGLALGAAFGANTALATTVIQMAGASAATVVTPGPSKLTLGLDTLSVEYQAHREAVARGVAIAGPFATQKTMARVDGERVVIDAVAADGPRALKTALEALGAEVTAVAGRMMSARLPLDKLPDLEGVEALQFARPAWATTRTGSVTSQGDAAQRSDLARLDFGVDGAGSTVGVLSDSFDCSGNGSYAADIGTGDLPVGVDVLDDTACPGSDEGRAMAQIVHDVAPGAGLAFRTAFNGEADFAQGILELAAAGSTIIVDDVGYFAEPMFQDGVIAQAVDAVDALGIPYFSAAGNSAREAYEAAFDGSGLTGPAGGEMHDFDPGPGVDTRLLITQNAATIYILQWQDPFFSVSGPPGAGTDLDICFYSPPGTSIGCLTDANTGGDPIEGASLSGAGSIEISIEKWSGPDPDLMKIAMYGSISFPEAYAGTNAGTVVGHPNATGANAVGVSAYFLTPAFGEVPPALNYYSSAGNTPILFDTAGSPILDVRQKPEITAPDGGNNTFFGGDFEPDGFPNFFGTSAAAPHAAGVAALMREVNPGATPLDITTALQDTAVDILERETLGFGGPRVPIGAGYDNDSGSGLIDAQAAVAAVIPPPPEADLSIAKTDDIDPIVSGNQLTYTVTVTNNGPDAAVNVVVTDTLPAGVTLVSTSGCAEDPNGVPTCSLGNIAGGASAGYTIVVDVDSGTSGTIVNQASVASDTADPNGGGNNSTTEDTLVTLFGDQDGDGCIGRLDVTILLGDVRAGTTNLGTQDINGDGAVNRADARALMRLYTNQNGVCP